MTYTLFVTEADSRLGDCDHGLGTALRCCISRPFKLCPVKRGIHRTPANFRGCRSGGLAGGFQDPSNTSHYTSPGVAFEL